MVWNPFRKKELEFDLKEETRVPFEKAEYAQPFTPPPIQSMPQSPPISEKDLELISAKLDAIKALLDNLNQRVASLERIARE